LSTQESGEELLHKLALIITQKRLVTPAILLLEMLKPLGFVCSQAWLLVDPLLSTLTGDACRRYVPLLEDRRNLERLLEALEARHSASPN
jgi:hypothetical protein